MKYKLNQLKRAVTYPRVVFDGAPSGGVTAGGGGAEQSREEGSAELLVLSDGLVCLWIWWGREERSRH